MSEITEIINFSSAVKALIEAQATYVQSGGTPPTLTALLAELEYPELLTFVVDQSSEGSGFQIGVAQEVINFKEAINRELEMASFTKANIYGAIQSNLQDEAIFYSQSGDFYSGVIRGNTTNGSQC